MGQKRKFKSMFDTQALIRAFEDNNVNLKHIKSLQKYILRNAKDIIDQNVPIDYTQIIDFPKKAIDILKENYKPFITRVSSSKESKDKSTTKLLIKLQDGQMIESVIMRYGQVELASFPEQEKNKMIKKFSVQNEDDDSLYSDGKSVMSNLTENRLFKSKSRATVCVSSQVGCAMGCKFCATGTMGLMQNLSSGEIIEQLIHANLHYSNTGGDRIKGVVFMAMGEPLDNYENVKFAVNSMCDVELFGLSPQRVSISTVGVVPKLKQMVLDLPMVSLALSLHAPSQDIRQKIVPSAKSWSLDKVIDAAYQFIINQNIQLNDRAHEISAMRQASKQKRRLKKKISRIDEILDKENDNISLNSLSSKQSVMSRRKILLEYVLLGPDINCTQETAHELGQFLSNYPNDSQEDIEEELKLKNNVLLNLIPYNPTDAGVPHGYQAPSQDVINTFTEIVRSYGIKVMVRQELGQDINAACGQLVVQQQIQKKCSDQEDEIEDIYTELPEEMEKNTKRNIRKRRANLKATQQIISDANVKIKTQKNVQDKIWTMVAIAILFFAIRVVIQTYAKIK